MKAQYKQICVIYETLAGNLCTQIKITSNMAVIPNVILISSTYPDSILLGDTAYKQEDLGRRSSHS